ncbi:hypothetical protein AAG570_005192 [Ranatra chinensis]|uniref:Uncharacterized protein n=1 Tax=Ranatra chinensis TaxID=642074 RepID=A0ABD0YNB9_9HEMI
MVAVLLHSVATTTMSLVSQREGAASEASDIVQAFLTLLTAVAKRNLNLLACSYDTGQFFRFATASLTLPEQSSVKAAASFLCALIIQSRDQSVLLSVVQDNGEYLVHTVLSCIGNPKYLFTLCFLPGGDSPRSVLDSYAEILLCLNKKYCDSLSRWLGSTMALADFPTSRPSPQVKANFSRMVLRERANKRKLQDTVKEFAFICRGIVNAEYQASAMSTALH